MIKYNLNTINDWNFGLDNIIKVYRNNAVCYYKIISGGSTPTYDLCYAVVDDISQYQETEFEDVFNKADGKWYKLNNLNQYEEYGVYVDSLSGSTRLPQGYTEVEYVTNNSNAYIDTGLQICSATSNTFKIETTLYSERVGSQQYQNIICCMSEAGSPYQGFTYRFEASNLTPMSNPSQDTTFSTVNNGDGTSGVTITCNGITNGYTHSYPLVICAGLSSSMSPFRFTNTKIYSFKLTYNSTLTLDYVPCKRNSDGAYGLYDLVGDTFVTSSNNNPFSGGSEISNEMTVYEGKLAIVDGYEYMWSGSSWVNLGEVSGNTATLPDVPFTVNYNAKNYDSSTKTLAKTSGQLADIDAVITAGTPTVNDGYLTIDYSTRATISGYQTYFNRDNNNPNLTIISKQNTKSTGSNGCHMFANRDGNYNWMYRPYSNKLTLHGSGEQGNITVTTQPVIESVRIDSNRTATYNNYTDNTSSSYSNFSYGGTNDGSTALFAGYATSSGEWFYGDFYWIYMSQSTLTDEQVQQVIDYNEGGSQTIYPKYYDDKSDPLDDLTFNTLEAAEEYAYNNCVYDGMKATIDGNKYVFDSEDGWVVVLEYYKVEDVTPNGASGWTITNSATYNPNSSYYDDFDLETNSTSYSYKIAKVTIFGYDHFTYYIRSYHGYSQSYGYAMASNIDELSTDPTSMSYSSNSAITHTYSFSKTAKSAVNLNNYRRVTYNNLDKTVEHTFYVVFYGRTYGSYVGNATILIPKEQTNENWEQVTFSASSIGNTSKNLYIDNSNTSSGGTQYFCYRWMIGLPSGSHSSYSNYSSYDYCPNVTSSTFTSVAGNSRQVNYSWNATTNKSLRLWLVDTSGNTLTPTNTVYYYTYRYSSCNGSSNSTITFTTSNVSTYFKDGGHFTLNNSSDRHYIYGYAPPTLGTTYYVDNYENNFYIQYTKLDDEAVTITYTTYDPNDSETPTFNTEITYPYNGGTKVTTATTSYNVPYTYRYSVSQTNNKYSAATQTFTAGQASRTVTFTLYPNNREFASVADMEAYAYAWEGMQASVNGTDYKYTNGEWVEQSYTQYEYIQTQTGNYRYDFNTNFYPTTANTIELKFTLTGTSQDWGSLLCWSSCYGDSCDSTQFRFTTVTSSYAIIGRKGNTSGVQYYVIGNGKTVTVTLPLSSSTYTYNTGSTNTTCSYNVGTFSLPSSTPMHILNLGYASDNRYAANVKLYYVKVYDGNGNLVKHYVPSDSNGTPCLYEIVNGTYILDTWTSSYHGTLTLGPEINT